MSLIFAICETDYFAPSKVYLLEGPIIKLLVIHKIGLLSESVKWHTKRNTCRNTMYSKEQLCDYGTNHKNSHEYIVDHKANFLWHWTGRAEWKNFVETVL